MPFRGWDKTEILDGTGDRRPAVAPLILSASRATDIPAFHAEWFCQQLARGWVDWKNPFSGRITPVSFERVRAIVFWTKNAGPFLPYLDELDRRGLGYYFQFTVNDYGREGLEPGLPPLDERIAVFRELSRRIGREKVIWRYDPLILAGSLTPDTLLARVRGVGDALGAWTEKLVFSFADIRRYRRVVRRLSRQGVSWTGLDPARMEYLAQGLVGLNRSWGLELAACAEEIDLRRFGIRPNRCIDDRLLARLFPGDRELIRFLDVRDPEAGSKAAGRRLPLFLPGIARDPAGTLPRSRHPLKDPGQRRECGCVASKDIGNYDTCGHHCVYCYASGPSPE